ncbi:MAG: TolC family protein [Tannerellaceae bacterium]|jgi:outer membrane protein TolC|nr:TolC family protein [Tannerellaceae bacterium]
MNNNISTFIRLSILSLALLGVKAGAQITLSLEETVAIAGDSSLEAFRSKNMYLTGYWQYRTYKAGRLPGVTLDMTPVQYYRDITRRYDSNDDIDVYRRQESYYASGRLAVTQNFDLLGGQFFLNSDIGLIRNFGDNTNTQYTSTPVRIGYSQSLVGYNPFKWERKIEPLKYEKAKKEFLYNMEQISEQAAAYFFDLAMAQVEYDMARDNVTSTDTLYRTGEQRQKIASITQADLLTLRLDAVNARNKLQTAEIDLKRAMFALASYLNFDKNASIRLRLPGHPVKRTLSVEEVLLHARENNPKFADFRERILDAEQQVDRTRKEALFDASLSLSIGFNQVAGTLREAYRSPLQQDVVAVSISIPLVDWGVRKGKYNMARNTLSVAQISARQEEVSLEEDLLMTVGDFNVQQQLISSAEEALDLAQMAYAETKQRFIIGKADINSLTLSLNRLQEAERNYIRALRDYQLSYYKIRKLTLHDFNLNIPLSRKFDYE